MAKPPMKQSPRKSVKVKAAKAWGVVTDTGRLRNYATRYRRQVETDLCFGDRIIPVIITPAKGRK